MSADEEKILTTIISSKNYSHKNELVTNITNKKPEQRVWIRFAKNKRKEEYIKYGFKLLVKNLMKSFKEQLFKIDLDSILNVSNKQVFFYLFYFGHLEFAEMFDQIIGDLRNGFTSENALWNKLGKYVFPEIGSQIKLPIVRSINKKFLKQISHSRDFINELLQGSVDLLLFFGYCWEIHWKSVDKASYTAMDIYGIQMLKKIGKVNRNEIDKLFAEWGNLVAKNSYAKESANNLDFIIENIKRSNFKFPWSFREIQEGMIHTFLSLTENINFDFLPHESESKGNALG
jgi:hypothetical protein